MNLHHVVDIETVLQQLDSVEYGYKEMAQLLETSPTAKSDQLKTGKIQTYKQFTGQFEKLKGLLEGQSFKVNAGLEVISFHNIERSLEFFIEECIAVKEQTEDYIEDVGGDQKEHQGSVDAYDDIIKSLKILHEMLMNHSYPVTVQLTTLRLVK